MIFDFLLNKTNRRESIPADVSKRVVSTGYYSVIKASDIETLDEPPFNQAQWSKEEEYKTYLESVQPLIEEYERTGSIHKLSYNSFDDIAKNREEQHFLNVFNDSFLDAGQRVSVEKKLSGKYKVVSNGRHRMYVAKKYDMKLLVYVAQEQTE